MILNLADPTRSEITFSVLKFSDGQKLLKIGKSSRPIYKEKICVISRMLWDDLQLILQVPIILKKLGAIQVDLTITYLLGARSDRDFSQEKNDINYMSELMGPILMNSGYDEIHVLDSHSDVTEAVLKGKYKSETILPVLVTKALEVVNEDDTMPCWIASPDGGAIKRTWETVKNLKHFTFKLLECQKHRVVKDGSIDKTTVPESDLLGQDVIIVDDICDGGRTFVELARVLKEKNAGRVFLCVTHFIGSAGLQELQKNIDIIFTTNSFQTIVKEPGGINTMFGACILKNNDFFNLTNVI